MTLPNRRQPLSVFLLLPTLQATLAGCGPSLIDRSLSEPVASLTLEQDSLSVTVEPLLEAGRIEATFDANLLKGGILPVQVSARNNHTRDAFILDKSHISLVFKSGMVQSTLKPDSLVHRSEFEPLLSFYHVEAVLHDLAKRELMDKTLYPGSVVSGFVYFPVTEPLPPAAVLVQARDPRRDRVLTFRFVVSERR